MQTDEPDGEAREPKHLVATATAVTAGDSLEAEMIKGMLETAGIPVMLQGTNIGFRRLGSVAGGPVDVVVPAERLAEARELLEEAEKHGGEVR
jgi:hypothetical protein